MKRTLLSVLTSRPVSPVWRPFVSRCAAIFMLHRFTDRELGVDGASIKQLRSLLAFLRRHRFPMASLHDLGKNPEAPSSSTRPTVVFTVDDGYADFSRVAAPVFAEFDCPVTVFLTTGPIEKPSWLWWNRVEHVVASTKHSSVRLPIDEHVLEARWGSGAERQHAAATMCETLKLVPNGHKDAAIADLATRLEVDLPAAPPPPFAAMTWSDVRACARRGVTFGPHTVTHPMLPQVSAAEAEWEILESWRTLRANCDAAIPVFCYPSGAYTQREVSILERSELVAAVTTKHRYTLPRTMARRDGQERFQIPRFAYSDDRLRMLSVLTGFERVNLGLQDGRDGWHVD